VTRWGEFSPVGRLFSLGSFFLNDRDRKSRFLGYFFRGKSYVFILTKIGWAIFWATFSQAHQMFTLQRYQTYSCKEKV
jgi:hypothetical protein